MGYRYSTALEAPRIEIGSGRPIKYPRLRSRERSTFRRAPRFLSVRRAGTVSTRFSCARPPRPWWRTA
eukprot:8444582-Pyramimonas_sp.AAC.1